MATSNDYTFTQTRDQIIRRAGRQCFAWSAGEVPGAADVADFTVALNAMMKEWSASGIHVWTEEEGVLFLTPGQNQYIIGPNSKDLVFRDAGSVALASAGNTGDTFIGLVGASTVTANQAVGIYMADGSVFWTTAQSVNDKFSVPNTYTLPNAFSFGLTLNAPLPSPALVGAEVFAYDPLAPIARPLRVIAARRYNLQSQLETPLMLISRLDFRDLPNKQNPGLTNTIFYDPKLSNGQMWVWPAPAQNNIEIIKFTWLRPIQNFDAAGNDPDLPDEWINALTWNLAAEMGPEYGLPLPRQQKLDQRAAQSLDTVSGWDREPESIFAGVNFDQSAR